MTGRVRARGGAAAPWLLVAGLLAVACEPARPPPRATVSLRLLGSPPDAAVIVDDEAIGSLDFVIAHGVALPPGVHHVTVQARGYFPWDHEVEAKEGGRPMAFEVVLVRVPD